MARSLFITGAGGYVGRRLLELIPLESEDRVVALSQKLYPNDPSFSRRGVEWVPADILDAARYESFLRSCDSVVHLAAVTGKDRPDAYFRVNTEGTRALVEACHRAGVSRFLFISTIAVKFHDTTRYYYAQSKEKAERIVMGSGLRYAILRPTIILGKGAPILQSLCRLAGAPLVPVFGDGQVKVQPIFVDDLVQYILSILDQDAFENQTLEVGGPQVLTMEELLLAIRRACWGKAGRVVHLPMSLLLPLVAFWEKLCRPLTPLTVGQLQSFRNDGTITTDPFTYQQQRSMKTVNEILALAGR